MVKISRLGFNKVDYTKTNETTRVPKTSIQTFQPAEKKSDYTTIVKNEPRYSAQLNDLKTKFEGIDAGSYINEAETNGFKMLVVADADYADFGAKWDKIKPEVSI